MRVSYFNNGSSIEVLEENNYYPFGLKHEGYNVLSGNPPYQYKYNGKELQTETGMYDYGWRQYMPDLGRWIQSDPLIKDLNFTFDPNNIDDDDDEEVASAIETTLGNGGGIFNPDNLSPYSYGYNNPIKFDDPDGRCPSCIFGALLEAGVDYGIQVAANYASGKVGVDAWTKDISLSSIALSAAEGALTQGAGAAKKFAIKGTIAIVKNTVDYNSSTGLKVEKSTKNIIKNTIVDAAAGGVAKKAGGFVGKAASKAGLNGRNIAKVVKQELRNNNVRITRNLNRTIASASKKVNPAIKKATENASNAALQKPVDKVKNKTNE